MQVGELDIERIGIEPLESIHDFRTRLYVQFADIVKNTEAGLSVVEALSEDPRVVALKGKMVSRGSAAQIFEVKTLAMWFLWCANECGLEDATRYMDSFLDSEQVLVLNSLWVLGIEVDGALVLSDGCTIEPITQMPDSRDKERFLQARLGLEVTSAPTPACAITRPCRVHKVRAEDPALALGRDEEFWTASQRLHDIALLLNALSSVSCVPYYSTAYVHPTTPFGPFASAGGGSYVYDVMGQGSTKLPRESAASIDALLASYEQLNDAERGRMQRILDRLSQAKRRGQIEDKILDLGIALEMLLLGDNGGNDQLSLTFRLRGAWLLGKSAQDRVEKYRQFKEIYEYRSQVAHGGVLCGGQVHKIESVRQSLPQYQSLAEDIVQRLMKEGRPDWGKLVLDAV